MKGGRQRCELRWEREAGVRSYTAVKVVSSDFILSKMGTHLNGTDILKRNHPHSRKNTWGMNGRENREALRVIKAIGPE